MAQKTIDMNLVKQVQQLSNDGVPIKEIVRRVGISRKTVKKYLRMMQLLPQPNEGEPAISVPDSELAAIIYNNDVAPIPGRRIENLLEHFEYAKTEHHKTVVNKQILWVEYLNKYADGYKYSQYCRLFMKFLKNSDPVFHWEYSPGEFTQADFAGSKLSYTNKQTREVIWCEVFIAILPFSGLIFCIAVPSQKTGDLVQCTNEMVKYIGGLTKTILFDNLKTVVTKADIHEPVFTEICAQLSTHYNTTFSATRPGKPKDKGMVEKAVDITYTNIYAPFRNEICGSLEDLNCHIRKWLDILNLKSYKGNVESRRDIFVREEQAILKPLPETPFILRKCKRVIVQQNYAIQLPDNKHYYTVPYQHVGHKVLVYFNERSVEVYYNHDRIAFHGRSSTEPKFNSPRTMIRQASIVTPGMVYGYGVIVYKSQEIKDAATAVAENKLYGQIQKQQEMIQQLQLISPALMMQEELSALSGTHWHQFNHFSKDVDTFRRKMQDFYYPKMAYDSTYRTFTVKDAESIPTFKAKEYYDYSWTDIKQSFFTYLLIIAVLMGLGYWKLLRVQR